MQSQSEVQRLHPKILDSRLDKKRLPIHFVGLPKTKEKRIGLPAQGSISQLQNTGIRVALHNAEYIVSCKTVQGHRKLLIIIRIPAFFKTADKWK